MEYLKLICTLTPDNEINRELLSADLGDAGFESFTETEQALEAYIPSKQFSEIALTQEPFLNNPFYKFSYTTEIIPDQNWNEVWEKNYFEPLMINDCCLIRAPFHTDYPKAEFEIVINPKMAFGTGNHETTHLMISYILDIDLKNKSVLDMGCGSGILGILASMRNAAHITGIDIDEWAYQNSIENCKLNGIENMEIELGDSSLLKERKFDIILANIQRNILLQEMQNYKNVLKKEGELIVSGFYKEDLQAIIAEAERFGLQYKSHLLRENWCAARFAN